MLSPHANTADAPDIRAIATESLQNLFIAYVLMYAPYRALVALARLPQPVFSIPYNGNGWYSPIDCVGTECFDGESNAYLGRPVGLQAATAHTLGAGRLLVVVATDRRARTLVRVICDRLRINQQLSCNASIGFSHPKTTLPDWVSYRNASTNVESTCKSCSCADLNVYCQVLPCRDILAAARWLSRARTRPWFDGFLVNANDQSALT